MLERLRHNWKTFTDAPTGKRFQREYESQRESGRPAWIRPLMIALGLLIMGAGAIALPAPGPGTLILAFGAALIAREFHWAAVALDWLEVRLRALLGWLLALWNRAPILGKTAMVMVALGVAGGAVWLAWTLYLRDKLT